MSLPNDLIPSKENDNQLIFHSKVKLIQFLNVNTGIKSRCICKKLQKQTSITIKS